MYELDSCLRAMSWGGGGSWGMEGGGLKTKAWNQVRSHIILKFLSSFLSGKTLFLFRKTQVKLVIGFCPSGNQGNRKRKRWLPISNAGISQACLSTGRKPRKPIFHASLAFSSVNFYPVKTGAREHTNLVPWWERFLSCHAIAGTFVEAPAEVLFITKHISCAKSTLLQITLQPGVKHVSSFPFKNCRTSSELLEMNSSYSVLFISRLFILLIEII